MRHTAKGEKSRRNSLGKKGKWTRRKISQNGAREKIAPSWGICGGKKKQTKIEESECTFPSIAPERKSNPCLERRQIRGHSDRNLITRKNRPGRRAAFVIASSDNRRIPIPITSSHTIIDEAAYLIFLLHFQPTAVERERGRGGGRERAMKEEITEIIKSRKEVSAGVGVGGGGLGTTDRILVV